MVRVGVYQCGTSWEGIERRRVPQIPLCHSFISCIRPYSFSLRCLRTLVQKYGGCPQHPFRQHRPRLDFAVVRASSFLLSPQSANHKQRTSNHELQLTIRFVLAVFPPWQDGNACPTTMLRRILRGAYTGPDEFVLAPVSTRGSPFRLPAVVFVFTEDGF